METTRRVSPDNISNPKSEDFPFDNLQVGDWFQLQPASQRGLVDALALCIKYSVDGKTFVFATAKNITVVKESLLNPTTYNIEEDNRFIYISRTTWVVHTKVQWGEIVCLSQE